MHTFETVLNREYINNMTNQGVSTSLQHKHVPVGVEYLPLEKVLVLVLEVLMAEHSLHFP